MPQHLPAAFVTTRGGDATTRTSGAEQSRGLLLEWQRSGTARFERDSLALRAELDQPTALPGWRRAHVIAHVARNADALRNLLSWARTGIETPMYSDTEARQRDIDTTSRQSADDLLDDLQRADARHAEAVQALPEQAWSAVVRTAQGRLVPAAQVLWLRVREVWVHAVDLDAGTTFADLPDDLSAALLDDALTTIGSRAGVPSLTLEDPAGRRFGLVGEGDPAIVRGALPSLAGYVLRGHTGADLTGNGDRPVPPAPRWL